MNGEFIRRVLLPMLAPLLLTACGSGGSGSGPTLRPAMLGSVHGGQSPVSGSSITLYAVGSGSSAATVLGSATTDSGGNFILGSFSCPTPGTLTYIVASGGNPGLPAGTDNGALHLLAALGACGSLPANVVINEVTTVAAAYALGGFISGADPDQILSSGTVGLTNAMGTAALLANPATGGEGPAVDFSFAGCYETGGVPPPNCGAAENLNSMANALAACVNSDSGASPQCTELFACAMPGASYSGGACSGGSGTVPADTLQAAVNIARNAGLVSMGGVYDVATRNAVFSPMLMGAPTDWTLSLNIGGGGLSTPEGIAIDASGNIWISNFYGKSLSEFSPLGAALSPPSGYTGGGLNNPDSLAIDASGNIWAANYSGNSLSKFSPAGVAISPAAGYTGGGLATATGLAIDPGGNVWAANSFARSVSEFSATGAAISPAAGFTGGGLSNPQNIAVDGTGNVWVTNTTTSGGSTGNDISELDAGGHALSPSSGYTGGGLNDPGGIAIDRSGNVWVGNGQGNSISAFNSGGTAISPATGYTGGGRYAPPFIAIDGAGNIWVPSQGLSISEYDSSGKPRSPNAGTGTSTFTGGFTGGGLNDPDNLAIDPSGNVWVVNNYFNYNTITEFVGAAAPTRTPLVSTLTGGFTPQ